MLTDKGVTMAHWFLGALVVILSLLGIVSSEAVVKVAGITSQCDTTNSGCFTIPLQGTILCGPGATCPTQAAPSFTNSNRFWGGGGSSCRTSSDGGTTWANCATQPLSSGGQEQYAGSSDGGVIAIGDLAGTCTIKKSTDNASNWSTVYSSVTAGCGGALTGGSKLKCLSDGRCDFVFVNGSTFLPNVLHSDNDGNTWGLTVNGGTVTSSYLSMAWDGTAGIVTANTFRSEKYTSGVWSEGAAAFAGCGTISGSVVYNGVGYGLCKDPGTNEIFRIMTADGALFKNITLTGIIQSGIPALAYSVGTDILYVMAPMNTAPSATVAVFVSRDNGVSFGKIFESPQSINSMTNRGDVFFANGCIYWSVLGGGSPMFMKIC